MKKHLNFVVLVLAAATLAGCNGTNTSSNTGSAKLKAGLITLHDENSTYDKNFIDAFKAACEKKGVEPVIQTNVPESNECYTQAADMADNGCAFVFADSFGHEDHIVRAAKEFPNVQFSHASGQKAHVLKLANFHNAFASIYEGRYLAGVAAGLKLQAMIEAKPETSTNIGYVGAHPFAEVISGYTSYYLGVRSVVKEATMTVTFTNSWYDETKEKTSAENLIENYHCSIISQHADSWGAPTVCENAKVPNVTYNGSTESKCPDTYLISSRINWEPYFEHCFDQLANKGTIETDYTGELGTTLYDGSVALTAPGKVAAVANTEEKLNEAAAKLRAGTLHVFDTSSFTVSGANVTSNVTVDAEGHVTSYKADVDPDAAYTADTEVVEKDSNGKSYIAESTKRSAPYFQLNIDGITRIDNAKQN